MPRIRTIKPEFWGDEKLAPMCALDRLVFLGIISLADDAGRLLDNVKAVDGFVFPESSDSARESLDRLAQNGRIQRYQSESGQRLIQIANWKRHQKIDHPAKYTLPGPPGEVSRDSREDDANISLSDLRPTTSDQRPSTDDQRAKRPAEEAPVRDARVPAKPAVAACAPLASPSKSIKYNELPPDVIEFGAKFYSRAPAERRRKIANQLLRLARGQSVRFKNADIRAASLERLAQKCRDVLDGNDVRKPDAAIAVLLTKLGDSTDVSAKQVKTDEANREEENRQNAKDVAAAEAWLESHPDVAASIDEELERQGHPSARRADPITGMARTWARRGLVLTAWRAQQMKREARAS